ncbi:MAG: hypothetical protein P1V51_13090 [Deltaproteobacteria bacterium]|nr:hypothetical protein [Deltaproteobacteria bacterium]
MRRILPPLLLPLLLLLPACDGGGGDTDGGVDVVTDEEYFGLALGSCFVLQGGLGGVQEMTIGVEAENDALGFMARQIRYRLGGFLRRTDYVTVEDGLVKIHQRSEVGSPNMDVEFDPPIDWLARPFRPTGTNPLRTDTTATDVFTSETETWTARTSLTEAESITVPGLAEAVEAFPAFVVYDRTDAGGGMTSQEDRFHLVPEVGFIKADLFGTDWPDVQLIEVRQLPSGETTCTGS